MADFIFNVVSEYAPTELRSFLNIIFNSAVNGRDILTVDSAFFTLAAATIFIARVIFFVLSTLCILLFISFKFAIIT